MKGELAKKWLGKQERLNPATWAGNSADMIHGHYRALMSAKDVAAFFEIWPKGAKPVEPKQAKPTNVVRLPQAAAR